MTTHDQEIAALEERIMRLERFITEGQDIWNTSSWMLTNGTLQEMILSTVKSRMRVAGPVIGQTLEWDE
jgi:hypothetical protein